MDRVLSGLHWETCLFYLDGIIVFSSKCEEHLAWLRQVFERLRHANLKLGAEKMRLCRQRGQLSGAPGYRGRPSARLGAPRGHPGDPTCQNHHRSPLFPWSHRVLPAICKRFCRHHRPPVCPDQERRSLPLEH